MHKRDSTVVSVKTVLGALPNGCSICSPSTPSTPSQLFINPVFVHC